MRENHVVPASADIAVLGYEFEYDFSVQLRYNYRLDPRPGHRAALGKAFGCARVVVNDALRLREQAHKAGLPYITDAELSARLTAAKRTPERAWLAEVSSVVLQQALADLNVAYRNYFASLNGKRKGPNAAKPRFRSRKDHRQAIRFTANARFKVLPHGKLRLPKIGDVPVRWSRPLPSEPSSVTVIKDSAGRYFASFVIETQPTPLPQTEHTVGIDGLGHLVRGRRRPGPPPSCLPRPGR
jgi:putative transposase